MSYLKDILKQGTETPVTVSKRLGQKDGNFGPQFHYKILVNDVEVDHYASLTEEKALQKFPEGSPAIAKKDRNNHGTMSIFWTTVDGKASKFQAKPSNPPALMNGGFTPPTPPVETEKSIEIGLRGIVQALISSQIEKQATNGDMQDFVRDAILIAESTHHLFAEAAHRIATKKDDSHLPMEDGERFNGVGIAHYGETIDPNSLPF